MTAEVALLNKSAIALAADSAVTVTYWDKNEPKTRYFKGANKVFNLSRTEPVGVMTFASANLNGVPWEIIIKSYRMHLKKNAHDHLPQYAADFFDFVTSNSVLFPQDVQEKQFVALCDRAAANITIPVTSAQDYKNDTALAKQAKMVAAFAAREAMLHSVNLLPKATQADIDDAIVKHEAIIAAEFRKDDYYKYHVPDAEMDRLAKLAIAGVFKSDFPSRGVTGLAFAGYGANEFFPRFQQYRCYGLILGKSYFEMEEEVLIDHSNAADVVSPAQSSMIDTFVLGASFSTMTKVHDLFVEQMDEFEQGLRTSNLLPSGLHPVRLTAS